MVAITADKVVVELEAKLGQYNVRVNGARQNFNRSMAEIGRTGRGAEALTRRNFGGMASAIAAIEGPLGGTASRFRSFNSVLRDVGPAAAIAAVGLGAVALGATQVIGLADKFTRFENRLKTAGLEGENLVAVGNRLFEIANRNGVEIEALGGVYARASLAAKELGADQAQLDTFVGAVSDGLRVQGSSAEASRGALLQLSQALGQDIVRAEEFNSILEGALPIAQAAARGISRFEGSVAKLRAAIIKGEVTSREFFEGIIKDAPVLAAQASKANLTLENSFTALYNQLARGVGQTDKSLGASERLSGGIIFLADNLGTLGEALTVITASVGSRLVAGLVKAGAEQAKFYGAVAKGDAVLIGGARAAEQRALATLSAARADEQASLAALNKARQVQASAVVSATDANAQFARAAATKQLAILEAQATAATAARTAAETAHAAALGRTAVAARAAALATRAYATLSGILGGPLGIGLTALAGTYLIVANRTAAATERTEKLQAELRSLGFLAPEVSDALDGTADSLAGLADDQIRAKIAETKGAIDDLRNSGFIGSLFGGTDSLDQIEFFARQFRTNVNPAIREAGQEIEALVDGVKNGTISADQLDKSLADLGRRDLGSGVDNLLASLREIGPTILASFPYIDEMNRRIGAPARFDAARQSAGRSGPSLEEISGRSNFLAERNRVASLDEQTRAIEKRAEAIQKEADKLDVVISKETALAQARREVLGEEGRKDADRLARETQQSAQTIADLQRAIEIFGNERQDAIDRAVRSLPDSASDAEIERVKELAARYFDLTEARRIDEVVNSEAKAEAIQAIRDEAAQLGVVGGALVELQFIQERYNELRAANIPITQEIVRQIEAEGAALRAVYEEVEAGTQAFRNNIQITDAARQGLIDTGKAGVRGFDDIGDAALRALENISAMILELYVLKPLVESILGPSGTSISGGLGSLLGFSRGTANTGGRRGEPVGVVHGQEAVIPLPAGGKVPVEIRMPAALKAGGGGNNINVENNVYITEGRSETQTRGGADRSGRALAGLMENAVKGVLQREKRQGGLLWNPGAR